MMTEKVKKRMTTKVSTKIGTEDLIDQTVEVVVGDRLRSEETFANQEALENQIRRDVEAGQKWFLAQKIK